MRKKPYIINYANGSEMKFHNKSISVHKHDEGFFLIDMKIVDKENVNTPSCRHLVHKGKVRHTTIKLSEEAVKAIVTCYMEYHNKQH